MSVAPAPAARPHPAWATPAPSPAARALAPLVVEELWRVEPALRDYLPRPKKVEGK